MPLYESVVIARQDISSTQVEDLAGDLTKVIEENGGSVAKLEHWGLRTLSYRIKKNRKGHYVLFNLDAPPPAIVELERRMRLNEDVLRYLTVRVEEHEEGPSSALQNKGRSPGRHDRSDRPDRSERSGSVGGSAQSEAVQENSSGTIKNAAPSVSEEGGSGEDNTKEAPVNAEGEG